MTQTGPKQAAVPNLSEAPERSTVTRPPDAWQKGFDRAFRWTAYGFAACVVVLLTGVVFEVMRHAGASMNDMGFSFLTESVWDANAGKFGILPSMMLMTLLGLVGFTVSRHLHGCAESSQRATLLSVRGLAFNIGYGSVSLGFSLLLAKMRELHGDDAFRQALMWQLPAVAVVIALFFVFAWRGRRASSGT